MMTSTKILNLIDLLQTRAFQQEKQRAFIFLKDGELEEGSWSYQQLEQRAQSIAAQLQQGKIAGERVLLLYQPGLEFIAAFFGCLYAGAIAVPAYPPRQNHSIHRLQAIVTDAQATIALTTSAQIDQIKKLFDQDAASNRLQWLATDTVDPELSANWQPPAITSDTLAFLQYTSGSTGTPKGVMVSHGNLLHNERMIQMAFQHTEETVVVGWLPLYHDMGLIGNLLQPLYLGRPCIFMSPVAFLQKPIRWLQAISRYKATSSGGPNFAYDLCTRKVTSEQRSQLDLSAWDLAFTGAEPIRADTLENFAATFADCGFRREAFYPCYGMAEGTLLISGGTKTEPPIIKQVDAVALEQNRVALIADEPAQVRSLIGCGYGWCGQTMRIVDPETYLQCPEGQVGEIWVAGDSVAQGYWKQPELTQTTFQAYITDTNEGPFLRTGDLGFLQENELFFTGRLKDIIIIRGCNHYPQDIELTVEQSHPSIRKPGCAAAFSVEITGEERLVVVAEVERRYRERRRAAQTETSETERRALTDRRQQSPDPKAEAERNQPLDVEAIIGSLRQAVAAHHGLQVYGALLLKAGSIPKTSSGKIQRYACRTGFLTQGLDVVGSSILGQ